MDKTDLTDRELTRKTKYSKLVQNLCEMCDNLLLNFELMSESVLHHRENIE